MDNRAKLLKNDSICPHCGRELHSGKAAHIRACGRRPTPAALRQLYAQGLTMKSIAERYGVARSTMSIWLTEAGVLTRGPNRRALAVYTDIIHDLAPLRLTRANDCKYCPGLAYCRDLAMSTNWILCEDPDDHQIMVWQMDGIDIYEVIDILKLLAPHLWEPERVPALAVEGI